MAEPILQVEGVVKAYGERITTRALDGIDLQVEAGELMALVGRSGSGKSTLLNLIGLLDRPTEGRITLNGTDTGPLNDRALTALRAKTLGFIFQFHHLLPAFTALENVILPAWGHQGYPDPAMRTQAEALLTAVGLAAHLHHRITDLSGGEQQRVAIARALARGLRRTAQEPLLVLADEPTGNLDTESADAVFELMRRFNHEQGTTFIVVTHDPRIAERCPRVVTLVDGRVHSDQSHEVAAAGAPADAPADDPPGADLPTL